MSADSTRDHSILALDRPSPQISSGSSPADRAQAAWFQSRLLETVGHPIIAVDVHRTVIYWNDAAEQMFGWTADEAIGRSSPDLISRDETPEQTRAIADAMGRGSTWSGVYEVARRDGRRLPVRVTNRPVFDRNGHLVAVIGVCRELSEAKAGDVTRRHLAAIVNGSGDAIFGVDTDGTVTTWNRAAEVLFGFTAPEIIGRSIHLIAPPDRREEQIGVRTRLNAGGPPERIETVRARKDGSTFDALISGSTMTDEDGTVTGLSVICRDITEARAAETLFEIGFEQSGIGTAIVGLDGVPTRVNAALCTMLGRSADLVLGLPWSTCAHPDDAPLAPMVRARVAAGHDDYEDERRFLKPDGTVVWARASIVVVRNRSGQPEYVLAQFQDITAGKHMERELERQSLHDALTGLPNRALLTNRLMQHLGAPRRPERHLAVISLNIDRLKAVNDAYGRPVGDELLQIVARRIGAAGRPNDTVARCAGDEFVVACDDVTIREIEEIAQRILDAVNMPMRCGGGVVVNVTASLGVAVADEGSSPEGLIRDSDVAMHRAKERGRGRVELFDEVLGREAEIRLTTISALRQGLERDELRLHFQPVVDLATGLPVGAEALVRWERPGHGLVMPAGFISLAEETGLIMPIGLWVLEAACRQALAWAPLHPSFTVAVNLSVRQLASPDIVERITDVLRRTGVDPRRICLELTESVLMDDAERSGRLLTQLTALGLHLSIDDFGTGYSSLSYLQRFPVDEVKVDRSFVDGLGTDGPSSSLVAAIIAMADALGLQVIAEGVETEEQRAALIELGCRRAQGYLFGRPMSADTLTELLELTPGPSA